MPATVRALLAAAALTAALVLPALPAKAEELIVVKRGVVDRLDDPFAPPARGVEVPRPGGLVALASSNRGRRAVGRALRQALRRHRISRSSFNRYVRIYRKAKRVRRGLRGGRGRQLGYVIASLERVALRGRLGPSRMPSWFAQVQRNASYWPRKPFPAAGEFVRFAGSEVLYRYFPGRGLQYHPLGTFKRANLMHGACKGVVDAPCNPTRLRRLLDEMARYAVRRGRGWIAWEYIFDFGGGSPPWMSGMAQATGIQALGRAAELLHEPRYVGIARKALGAFETAAPVGVKARGFRGGVHYLQYSFARHTFIFNAFTQAVLGLYDFSKDARDDRAGRLFAQAEPELEREIPFSDLGDWSMYSYRGEVSDASYHELLREVMHEACIRGLGDVFCTYAERYGRYQTEPPEIHITGPVTARSDELTRVRFTLSKLSAVELTASKGNQQTVDKIASFRRGRGSFRWRPRSPGTYTVRLGAKELRTGKGLKGRDSATVAVE